MSIVSRSDTLPDVLCIEQQYYYTYYTVNGKIVGLYL